MKQYKPESDKKHPFRKGDLIGWRSWEVNKDNGVLHNNIRYYSIGVYIGNNKMHNIYSFGAHCNGNQAFTHDRKNIYDKLN